MYRFFYVFLLVLTLFFVSCAGQPKRIIERPIDDNLIVVIPPVEDPIEEEIIVDKPEVPSSIMGSGLVSAENLSIFLMQFNPQIDQSYINRLSQYYIDEAEFEGVNHDIAFVQMCLETGFLAFGGLVTPDQYNFAGLGATGFLNSDGIPDKGLFFPDPRTGVRAQIQHLKAYGSTEPLTGELVNPRFRFVRRGSSPTIEGLAGTWAADRQYAVKINAILERLYEFAF